ncbi:MAG: DUF3592 domain-containing protein [Longimicrobiaceae bacterium]
MGILIALGMGFGALGVLLMGAAAVALVRARRDAASRRPAWGVVVALRPVAGLRGSIYCPVVEFRADSGERVTIQSATGAQPPLHAVGQRVAVFYPPGRPGEAELQAPPVLWLVPAGIFAVGLVFASIGALVVLGFALSLASSP